MPQLRYMEQSADDVSSGATPSKQHHSGSSRNLY